MGELRRVDSLRDKQGGKVREVRCVMGKEVGEREGARAHRRRRIRVEMLAGLPMIDEKFHPIGGTSSEREKRGEGGV
jgi:hypothetical protein